MAGHQTPFAALKAGRAVALVMCLLAVSGFAAAQPAALAGPLPAWHLQRGYQVWHDELPERLDPEQVDIVVLAPDERCRPPRVIGPFGLSFPPSIDNVTAAL